MNDNKFLLILWAMVIAPITALLLAFMYFVWQNDQAIIKSPDPLAAACAITGSSHLRHSCVILGQRK